LQESEEKYRKLVENVQDGIFILQGYPYPKLMFCNEAFAKMVGYTVEEMMALTIQKYVAPDDLARVADSYRRRLDGEDVPREYEYHVMHKDGKTPVYVNMHAELMEYQGKIATIGTVKDVTERKQAEEALRESEGKLKAMLQSIGDHMSMMDKDLDILWANETAKKVFGEDIIGKKCYEVYHGRKEPCNPYPCLTLKAFQDGKGHGHDTQVIDKDGEIIHFRCTANVALKDETGKPTAVI